MDMVSRGRTPGRPFLTARQRLLSATDPAATAALQALNGRLAAYYHRPAIHAYHRMANDANQVWSRPNYQRLIAELAEPGMSVIDMGCGSGHAFRNLQERGVRYLGIDWSAAQMDENARAFGTGPLFVARSLYDTGLPPSGCDLCFSLYVLEHLVWPHLLLREMVRLTRPGGLMAILCPAFRPRGRIPSLRYGKVVAPLKEKLRRGLWVDAARHLYLRTVHYPWAIRRQYPRERFPFLINPEPSCLEGAYYADNDAVYLVDREEVSDELARQGAADCTAALCRQHDFAWPAPRGLALVIARKTI
jgi:SAM-dependent methyltransferase